MHRIVFFSFFVSATALAGGIHKCKQVDGSVAFSNIACPQDTVSSERVGTHSRRQQDELAADNPYSVTRQLQQFEIKEAEEKQARLDKQKPELYRPGKHKSGRQRWSA